MNEELGLSILGSGTALAAWSALNPSAWTVTKFGIREGRPEDVVDIRRGMVAGLVACGLLGFAMYAVYGKKGIYPAVATGGTGAILFGTYEWMLRRNGR